MRTLSVLLSVAVLLVAGPVRADDEAKAILEKAIKAHGGAEKLTKFKAGTLKGKGKVYSPVEVEFTQESSYLMPDKVKETVQFEIMCQKVKVVSLINGDKLSLQANGMDVEVKDALKKAMENGRQQLRMGRLVPLRDKMFELTSVGEVKVNDKPAVGIRVVAKGMKDVNLYFDKKTGLMVKIEGQAIDANTGKEVSEERIISEYKMVDGMAMPQKILVNRDDKKYLELTIEEAKFLETIDESEFKKE